MSGNKPTFYKSLQDLLSVSEGRMSFCAGRRSRQRGSSARLTAHSKRVITSAVQPHAKGWLAAQETLMTHSLESTIREAYAAFGRCGVEGYLKPCTEDFTFNIPVAVR